MSEPVSKQRQTVDLDNFERRLRQSTHPLAHEDDPLAELARLVGEHHDPYGDVFAQEARPRQPLYGQPGREPSVREPIASGQDGRREPGFDAGHASPRLFGDFAAIEAGLRRAEPVQHTSSDDAFPGHVHHNAADPREPYADHGGPGYGGQESYEPGFYPVDAEASPARADAVASRSKRPMYIMAATIAVAVIGIGGAFALKSSNSSPGQVKTIMAAAGPIKVQPPADTADQSKDDASTASAPQGASKLVSREEQPLDLAQAVQDNVARNPEPAGGSDASSVPVPLSPGRVQAESVQADGLNSLASSLPAPKKVKVVSVTPEGVILPNDQPPAAAMPAPRQTPSKTSDRSGPVAKASTPKTATPKTTSRVAPTSIAAAGADSDAGPTDLAPRSGTAKEATAKAVKKPKPQRVATADTGAPEAQEATEVPEPQATGGGGFAVQLAAPGSEAEAKAASSRLGKKFADALTGHRLAFHKAESNGKSVYRVRVSSLTRENALSLCEKLKADGGSCFVAKD